MRIGSPASEEMKGVGVALEGGDQRLRLSALLLDFPDGVDRVAKGHAGLQVE